MNNEKPRKKTKDSSDRGKGQRARGKDRNRGSGNRGSGNRGSGNRGSGKESVNFQKRSLESNWSRYDEPGGEEHSDASLNEDEYDETKDLEYIKSNTGGATSHFQFQEEKEWQERIENDNQISPMADVLQLNLQQLSADLKVFDIIEMCLPKLGEEYGYCISSLPTVNQFKENLKRTNRTSDSPEFNKEWDKTGIEKYLDLFKQYGRRENDVFSSKNDNKNAYRVDENIKGPIQKSASNTLCDRFTGSHHEHVLEEQEYSEKEGLQNIALNSSASSLILKEKDFLDQLLNSPSHSSNLCNESLFTKISPALDHGQNSVKTLTVTEDDFLDQLLDNSSLKFGGKNESHEVFNLDKLMEAATAQKTQETSSKKPTVRTVHAKRKGRVTHDEFETI